MSKTEINKEFFNELLELCRKHKVNINNALIQFGHEHKFYEVDINAAWDILKTENQLEVFEKSPDKNVFNIKGTK